MRKCFQSTSLARIPSNPCYDLPCVRTFTISPFSIQLPQLNAREYILLHINLIEPWLRTILRCNFTFYPHNKRATLQCLCCWKSPVKKHHVVSLWKNHPLLAVCLEEPRQTAVEGVQLSASAPSCFHTRKLSGGDLR